MANVGLNIYSSNLLWTNNKSIHPLFIHASIQIHENIFHSFISLKMVHFQQGTESPAKAKPGLKQSALSSWHLLLS